MTSWWRQVDVDATLWRRIDVDMTSSWRHVPAGYHLETYFRNYLPDLELNSNSYCFIYEPPRGKTNIVVSEQVRHKPACTTTEKS